VSYIKLIKDYQIIEKKEVAYIRQQKLAKFMFPFLYVKDFLNRFPMYWGIAHEVFKDPVEIYNLTRDYVSFHKHLKKPNYFKKEYSPEEISAMMLHNRIRNSEEEQRYLNILKRIAKEDFTLNTYKKIAKVANSYDIKTFLDDKRPLDEHVNSYVEKHHHSLNVWQKKMVKELLLSIVHIKKLDIIYGLKKEKLNLTILIPVYHELNRLKSKRKSFTGEDFLTVKLNQLQTLFSGSQNINWNIVFVSDEAPSDSVTIAAMKKKLQKLQLSQEVNDNVLFLDYNDFAVLEKLQDQDKVDYFDAKMKKSVKGGAIQYALKYLFSEHSSFNPDYLLMSDSDLSFDLGLIGNLLYDSVINKSDVVIGSRNMEDSYIVGKSESRQVLSKGFNLLVKSMLALNINDTQVGAKMYRASLLKELAPKLRENSMSYDVEILKKLQIANVSIKEIPIVWIDSSMESHSNDQVISMFSGILSIYDDIYGKSELAKRDTVNVANRLFAEEDIKDVINLARNKRWIFMVENIKTILEVMSVDSLKEFLESFKYVFSQLSGGELNEAELTLMIETFKDIINELSESNVLSFLNHQFPELMTVIELLHKEHSYYKILLPFLLGTSIELPIIYEDTYYSLAQYENQEDTSFSKRDIALAWKDDFLRYRNLLSYQDGHPVIAPDHDVVDSYDKIARDNNRLKVDLEKLSQINAELESLNETINIGIVMSYNQDNTSDSYIKKVLGEKMEFINEHLSKFNNIHWHFEIMDARQQRKTGVNHYIDWIIAKNKSDILDASQLHMQLSDIKGFNKGFIIRKGLTALKRKGYDYLAYVDFSNKIDFAFITSLLNNAWELQQASKASGTFHDIPVVSIGSRYMEKSVVKNKPLAFIMRSMGMNLIIKMIFPKLFKITDTQAGFKLFSHKAWEMISDKTLESDYLAFDVEILQQAKKLDIDIGQVPINFYDKKYEQSQRFGVYQARNVFKDLIEIRSRLTDTLYEDADKNEPIIINGGAEHLVCKWNDMVFKIPYESIDTNYFLFMKNLVFQNRKGMTIDQQEKRLTASPWYKKIIDSKLGEYIPLLRRWVGLNVFIMKTISLLENKQYKSVGYQTAYKYGKDLIVPYRFIDERFTITINGNPYTFDSHDKIKVSPFVEKTGVNIFSEMFSLEDKPLQIISNIKSYMEEVSTLFLDLWRRGLFDLDTNILYDLGYFPNSRGVEVLMVIDPGEIINNRELLDIDRVRSQIMERDDLMEIEKLISNSDLSPKQKEDINSYIKDVFFRIFDFIEKDSEMSPKRRLFASALREDVDYELSNVALILPQEMLEGSAQEVYNKRKEKNRALLEASINYQSRYLDSKSYDIHDDFGKYNCTFHHLLPTQDNKYQRISKNENVKEIPSGAIKPIMRYLAETPVSMDSFRNMKTHDSREIMQDLKNLYYIDIMGAVEEKFKEINSPEDMTDLSKKNYTYQELVQIFDILNTAIHGHSSIILDGRKSAVIMPDAGYGMRTGLLGLSAGAKGLIKIEGNQIYKRVLRYLKPVTDIIDTHDFVTLCSSDDILEHSSESAENIKKYFELPNSPGYYFLDLPGAGENLMPISSKEIVKYIASEDTGKIVEDFLSEVPILKGAIDNGLLIKLQKSIEAVAEHYLETVTNKQKIDVDSPGAHGNVLFDFLPKDLIKHFVTYKATMLKGGAKTPFFFIFKKEFLQAFNREVIPLIPDSLSRYLTWKMLLVDGMKADLFSWELMRNKLFINKDDWIEIYRVIHQLKERFNIRFDDKQNDLRVFHGAWRNFDDAVQIFRHARKHWPISSNELGNNISSKDNNISFYSYKKEGIDYSKWTTASEIPVQVVLVEHQNLKGTIKILTPEEVKKNYPFVDTTDMKNAIRNNLNLQVLFYDVDLEEGSNLQVFPFHVVAKIEYGKGGSERPFMMPYGLMTKEQIRNAPVYSFNTRGVPSLARNPLFKGFYRDIIEERFLKFMTEHERDN